MGNLLKDVPLDTRRDMWYLQYGASAHYAREVGACFNENYPGQKWSYRLLGLSTSILAISFCSGIYSISGPLDTVHQLRNSIEEVATDIRTNPDMIYTAQIFNNCFVPE